MLLNKVHLSANTLFLILYAIASSVAAQDPFDFDLSKLSTQDRKPPINDHWQFAGYLESRAQYFSVENYWVSNRLLGFVELKWAGDQNDSGQWRAYGSAMIEYDRQTQEYRDPKKSQLKELYIIFDSSIVDLTIGKQRVAWGMVDGVSTIDRVNAKDLRDPIGNARTASRRPSWLFRSEVNTFNGIVDMVWLPVGRDRKLPEFGSPWEPASIHALRTQQRFGLINLRVDDPHKSEGGLRYLAYGKGFDWSIAYFNGYTDEPLMRAHDLDNIRLAPVRIETFNASGALGTAQSTWRAEFTYTPNSVVSGKASNLWQIVVGWDRTFFTNLKANLQFFYDKACDAPDSYGTTFSFSNVAFDDAAIYGLRGQLMSEEQLALEVYFHYKFSDNLTLNTKYLTFDGAPKSALFDYRNNNFLEMTLRWDF